MSGYFIKRDIIRAISDPVTTGFLLIRSKVRSFGQNRRVYLSLFRKPKAPFLEK